MFISPKFCLKSVSIDGITLTLNSEEAKDIKRKYPQAVIKNLRKSSKRSVTIAPVKFIDPAEYNAA